MFISRRVSESPSSLLMAIGLRFFCTLPSRCSSGHTSGSPLGHWVRVGSATNHHSICGVVRTR